MRVGLLTIELSIGGAFSLKEKRMVVNRVRDRVRRTFNVAIAEVDLLDVWNAATMGVVTVSNDGRHVDEMLSKVVNFVSTLKDCEIEDYSTEMI
ncbi:MAG: DUF503 domain-containing protein [Lentisphaerae bacterium]|jgi:uncharacterized protein|nr:DUF503 domain-containing protein [Lentisphaerota bacterium]MBT4817985.1 DUF503 domain-containing protein [Lentisphaerota bacterium]MBT5605584.1 DUF503 domain-containing protein [Lentisphaerota bacterium]MBT7054856.1 DUF503 domain-containing protein [Lentisphaerota bacterium]MBT7841597.1 DUF503 domain-containing protein [Lentisphaerota bacterium]